MNSSLEAKAASFTAAVSSFVVLNWGSRDQEMEIRKRLGLAIPSSSSSKTSYVEEDQESVSLLFNARVGHCRYDNLEKRKVLEGFGALNDPAVVQKYPYLCSTAVCMVLQLLNTTTTAFTRDEAGQILNAAPQLYDTDRLTLRRYFYLLLKELAPLDHTTRSKIDTLVWKSLRRDCRYSKVAKHRAYTIRVMATILLLKEKQSQQQQPQQHSNNNKKKNDNDNTDGKPAATLSTGSSIQQFETPVKRILKLHPSESYSPKCTSAVLVSAIHLQPVYPEIVQGWRQAALCALYSSRNNMVHFHALQFLLCLRQDQPNDNTEQSPSSSSSSSWKETKLLEKLHRQKLDNQYICPLSWITLIRYTTHHLLPMGSGAYFLTACLTHPSALVAYEAARAMICFMVDPPDVVVERALETAEALALSSKPAVRNAGRALVEEGKRVLADKSIHLEGQWI